MTPEFKALVREVPLIRADEPLGSAIRKLADAGTPALPVVDGAGDYAGVFGERTVIRAVLPGYVGELSGAAFVRPDLDEVLEHRRDCIREPVSKHMLTERVQAPVDFSSAQLAETFLHHRVALIPIVDGRKVVGAVLRRDFVRLLAERLLASDAGAGSADV
jgi:CBS domain-containing protein